MSSHAVAAAHAPTGLPTSRLGIWVFLASEVLIFGGLIVTYVLCRSRHPEWGEHAAHAIVAAGAVNTLVLLSSSLSVVLAHEATTRGRHARAAGLLGVTVLLGFVFLAVKAYEYTHEIQGGYTPVTNLFWSFYYLMTGLHALHVVAGMVALTVVALGVRGGCNPQRVEYAGMYWHLVDIVWIFLFPLLYLAS
jgi:heme/copper-type cytochrome/quinol oxidase subunit 3